MTIGVTVAMTDEYCVVEGLRPRRTSGGGNGALMGLSAGLRTLQATLIVISGGWRKVLVT